MRFRRELLLGAAGVITAVAVAGSTYILTGTSGAARVSVAAQFPALLPTPTPRPWPSATAAASVPAGNRSPAASSPSLRAATRTITGRVTDLTSRDLTDIDVSAWDIAAAKWAAQATTDASGAYSLEVSPGLYNIFFEDPGSWFATEIWTTTGLSNGWDDAGTVDATKGDRNGINARLPRGYPIIGDVRTSDAKYPNIVVELLDETGGTLQEQTFDSAGYFYFVVGPGTYYLKFSDSSQRHANGYWRASGFTADPDAKAPVVISSSAVSGLDVVIPLPLGQPTNVTAVAANGSAKVSWVPPTNDGGAPIQAYTVASSPDDETCDTSRTSCTVTDLTNGQAYTFTVTASNAAVDGPDSNPSNQVTPLGPPSQPSDVTAAPGDTSAVVSWTAPDDDGGRTITGYTATSSPGSKTCHTKTDLSCTITGLTNGQAYTFTIRATSALGTGPASDPSTAVTPAGVPGKPTSVVAVRGVASAVVSWAAPIANGSPITRYTVTASPGSRTCTAVATRSCTVTGLANGQPYTFTVTATNRVGTSLPSVPSAPVTTAAAPGKPTNVVATSGSGSITLKWTAPPNNGSPITGYTATETEQGLGVVACTMAGATACIVTGLSSGVSYTFTVTAINAVGAGHASDPSSSVTPSAAAGGEIASPPDRNFQMPARIT